VPEMTEQPYPDHRLSELPAAILRPARTALWLGVMGGLLLLVLALMDGFDAGPSVAALAALARIFPGYGSSTLGSLAGMGYGFAAGAAGGWIMATVYNRLAA